MGVPDADADVPQLPAWGHVELMYDTSDPTRVWLDRVPLDDGRTVIQVVAGLGAEGWEMVSAGSGTGATHILWFRRAVAPSPAGHPQPGLAPAAPGAPGQSVVLTAIGNARFDKELHARLVAAVGELAGVSGWRATRIVDKAPRVVATGLSAEEAGRIADGLRVLGATVEIR